MQATAAALAELGVAVQSIEGDEIDSAARPDVVHGFGLQAAQIRMLQERMIPVAISPIYLPRAYGRIVARSQGRSQYRRSLVRHGASFIGTSLRLRQSWKPGLSEAFSAADVLLPNSLGEARALRRDLRISTPIRVVPNGVDARGFRLPEAAQPRESVLYVGRIEPHKNQLSLIRALRGTGMSLKLVGPTHPHHEEYAELCLRAAHGQPVEFISELAHPELAHLYQAARVHAMPSLFETTGLASLEAALCGAAIVTTSAGWAREYFGAGAEYCSPASLHSIRAAVRRAWDRGPDGALRERILSNYTWEHVGRATRDAYDWLLSR
jgi:glycosyltransferase involved in cell wall biosynthesis